MSDSPQNRLLEEFQSYLATVDFSQLASEQPPDLHTLLSELASLKSEVKAESRHFKTTLDVLSTAVTGLQNDNQALATALNLRDSNLQQQQKAVSRTLLMEFVDIYDRMLVGLSVLQNYQPPATSFFAKKSDDRFINSVKEGQEILLKRMEQLLQRHQIRPIECLGLSLDPHTMNAVEVGRNPKLGNGIVLEELRKGFLFDNEVLRLAEVKVNKL